MRTGTVPEGFVAVAQRKAYRFLSGVDDAAFCQRIVGQAIIDPVQIDPRTLSGN